MIDDILNETMRPKIYAAGRDTKKPSLIQNDLFSADITFALSSVGDHFRTCSWQRYTNDQQIIFDWRLEKG